MVSFISIRKRSVLMALLFFLMANYNAQHTYGYDLLKDKTTRQVEGMLKEVNQKIARQPSEKENYFNKIIILNYLGDTAAVRRECDQLIKRDPLYWPVYNQRGVLRTSLGEYKQARADFERTIEIAPENPLAYNNIGYLLYITKDYKASLGFYEQAIEKDSLYAEAYINKMDALYALNDFDLLEKISDRLVRNFNKDPRAFIHRAEFYTSQGRLDEASKDYDRAVVLDSNKYALVWTEKIKFIDDVMNKEYVAIDECNKAAAADPKNYLIYYTRSRPKLDLKMYRAVITDCNLSLKYNADYNPSYVMRGMAYAFLGLTDSSLHDFDKAILLEPKEEEAYVQKSISLVELQKYPEALAVIDLYLKNDIGFKFANIYKPTSILQQRGNINFSQKKYNEAINDYKRAIQLSDTNAQAWLGMGEAYLLLNEREHACEAFSNAEKLGDMKAKTKRIFNCR